VQKIFHCYLKLLANTGIRQQATSERMCSGLAQMNDISILDNAFFSDASIFHLSGTVNRHNYRICGSENLHEVHEYECAIPS
jgi:hypothetical protein